MALNRWLPLLMLLLPGRPASLVAQRRLAWDASLGVSGTAQRAALSAWRQVAVAPLGARIALGVRVSGYGGDAAGYTNRGTIQAGLPGTLVLTPGVFGLNGAVAGELPVGPLLVGANLDLVGLSAGPSRGQGTREHQPQTFSYFGYEARDHGALNSEFYVAVRGSRGLTWRAGASHYVTNHIVTDVAAAGRPSARYQRFETVLFGAVRLER